MMAFTLVEVLTVVAIVGLLIAMLYPVLQSARQSADQAECLQRLRAHAVGIRGYMNDHQVFPSNGEGRDSSGQPLRDPSARRWFKLTAPYLEKPLPTIYTEVIFKCPFSEKGRGAIGIYGLNNVLANNFNPIRVLQVSRPAKFPVLACVGGEVGGALVGGQKLHTGAPHPMARRYGWTGAVHNEGPSPNHKGGVCNFLFADGHIESVMIADPTSWPWNTPDAFSVK
jgi:prepilin-type processing-associated H-X9-DG protein/prepilin-type N-terminal cleavage/methylation domain-containing protein